MFSNDVLRVAAFGAAIVLPAPYVSARAAQPMAGGVNLAGMEFNAGVIPGRPNWDYAVPSDSELAYYQGKGMTLVRLPVLWERLEPSLMSPACGKPALDPNYVSLIKTILMEADARAMSVIVDMHDYGGYGGNKIGAAGGPTEQQFVHAWRLIAATLAGTRGLAGYDLMNEPNGLPDASIWPASAQKATDAIRKVDAFTPIYVEGDQSAGTPQWQQANGNLNIVDPSGRVIYEGHVYGDQDNSGTHFAWSDAVANGVTVNTIAERLLPFTSWCQSRGVACMIGEIGVGNDDPAWNAELSNGLAAMQAAGLVSFTYWAGGPWWGTYPLSIEPQGRMDAPQMAVVSLY